MSPQRNGTCCFWCGSRRLQLIYALYLLNQWVDFDQTGTDTLLWWGKEVIRFWWRWPHFQGHTSTFLCQICRRQHSFLSALYLLNKWVDFDQSGTDTLLGREKEVLDFQWSRQSFRSTRKCETDASHVRMSHLMHHEYLMSLRQGTTQRKKPGLFSAQIHLQWD